MARMTNTPRQSLEFDLERRKSYAFRCTLLTPEGGAINLAGCTLRFIVKPSEFDDDTFDTTNMIVNTEATIDAPETGVAVFNFQAAELDADPGDYYYRSSCGPRTGTPPSSPRARSRCTRTPSRCRCLRATLRGPRRPRSS